MDNQLSKIKDVAIEASKKAAEIIKNGFGQINNIEFKNNNPRDLVTNIDKEAEKIILKTIHRFFPEHNIIAEESGKNIKKSQYSWYIDPIDGTSNFTKKIPTSTSVIGIVKNNETLVAVVNLPFTNEIYWAIKGQGAFRNNQKIIVSNKNDITKSFACVEWWSRNIKHQKRGLEVFNKVAHTTQKIRYISSTAWDICRVASGEFDFHICDTTFLDLVAPKLILEEAGGKMTDEDGHKIYPKTADIIKIISSNNILHKKIIDLIK